MVLLDLFSGTGGFPLGFMQAGIKITSHYFSEIDTHAIANYSYNFPDALYAGAIEKINPKKIKHPDLITFGFPCQDLSAAGKRKGLSGKRSGLFFQAIRLIRELKPSTFIFENVKGLLFSNQGKDFETVLKEIANLGLYDCQWQLLNTSWFLPQNRERIYFVGHLREKGSLKIFPFTESHFISEKSRKKTGQKSEDISTTLTSNYSKGVHARGETYVDVLYWKNSKEKWTREKKNKIPTLKTQSDLTRQPLIAPGKYDQFDKNGKGNNSQFNRIYRTEFPSPTLTATGSESCKIYDYKGIRRLTPTECERLQGFPDGWTQWGNYNGVTKEISDTQRYRLMGNAVSIPTVKAIALCFKNKTTKNKSFTLNGLPKKAKKIYQLLLVK